MGDGIYTLSKLLLNSLLSKEKEFMIAPNTLAKITNRMYDGSVTSDARDCEVRWMVYLGRRFNIGLNTLGLSAAILDRILSLLKVKDKYLNCVAVASMYIAVKFHEELDNDNEYGIDEDLGDSGSLSEELRTLYSVQELNRMERSLLATIGWDLLLPSCDRFLSAMLAVIGAPHLAASGTLRRNFELVISEWSLISTYRPSVLALSLLSYMLELTSSQWARITDSLKVIFKVEDDKLAKCRRNVVELLSGKENIVAPQTKNLYHIGSGFVQETRKGSRKRARPRQIFGVFSANDQFSSDEVVKRSGESAVIKSYNRVNVDNSIDMFQAKVTSVDPTS